MNTTWQTFSLEELACIQGGGTPSRNVAEFFVGEIPWVTPTDLPPIGHVGTLRKTKECISQSGLSNSSAKLIDAGSVLFSTRASIGKIALTECPCATNQGFTNFTPKKGLVDPWFLAYLLCRYTPEITSLAGKTTFLEIPRGRLKSFKVQVPELSEQRRIVARIKECMERVDEIESLRARALNELHDLPSALIESELRSHENIPEFPVGKLVTKIHNGRSISADCTEHANGAVLTLTAVHSINLGMDFRKPIVLPEEVYQQFSIQTDDVFVSRANTIELVGLSSVAVSSPTERLIYPDILIKLRVDREKIIPRYLAYALRSSSARMQIKDRALGSSQTMVKISGERLRTVVIPVPTIDAQKKIVKQLDSAYSIVDHTSIMLTEKFISTLRESILRKAFTGEF